MELKSLLPAAPAKMLFNIAGSQAGWWGLVLSASVQTPIWGYCVSVSYLLTHFLWVARDQFFRELRFVIALGFFGWMMDGLLNSLGFIRFYKGAELPVEWLSSGVMIWMWPPWWLLAIWLGFASTVRYSLRPLLKKPWIAGILGAIFGPGTYFAGVKFGLLEFPDLILGLGIYAVVWGGLLALLSWQLSKEPAAPT